MIPLKKFLALFSVVSLTTLFGCVSINDNTVQVRPPERVDIYQRNVLDKCTPHLLPSRIIQGTLSAASTLLQGGGADVNSQKDFDFFWANITPDLTDGPVTGDLKPSVNWDVQTVRFFCVPTSNTCEKVQAYGMETDCYQITLPFYKYVDGKNCSTAPSSYPVFVYIYPKGNLPLGPRFMTSPYLTPTPGPQN